MNKMPWDSALLAASQEQAEKLALAEEEILRLKVTITGLMRRLREARMRQENWLLRQQAWRAERNDLLSRLSPNGKAREERRERERFRLRDDGP